jgi:hypothetical protein
VFVAAIPAKTGKSVFRPATAAAVLLPFAVVNRPGGRRFMTV